MKPEDLFNAITNLRDDQVEKAKPRPRLRRWIPTAIAACLVLTLVIAIAGGFPQVQTASQAIHKGNMRLATAVYPALKPLATEESAIESAPEESEPYYADSAEGPFASAERKEAGEESAELQSFWAEHTEALEEYGQKRTEYADQLSRFWLDSAKIFLSGDYANSEVPDLLGNGDDNRIYAPTELLVTLGMTAEITTGPARQEILDLLGSASIEDLRQTVKQIWNANYAQEEDHTLLTANSIWLRDDTDYHQDVLDILARDYYTDSFAGEMGSDEYNGLRRDWIDEKTNGFLSEVLENNPELTDLPPQTNLALTSTTYFNAEWEEEFKDTSNTERTFHNPDGDIDCTFMGQSFWGTYYLGDTFGAVAKDLQGGSRMLFLLPNEGTSTDSLLGDTQCRSLITYFMKYKGISSTENSNPCQEKELSINLAVPKFDITSTTDLGDGLKQMGVKTAMEEREDNWSFAPLLNHPTYLKTVPQTCRFKMDEKKVEAASFTSAEAVAAGMILPEDEIDFILDRPFLFLLVSDQGLPIYIGVVNQP